MSEPSPFAVCCDCISEVQELLVWSIPVEGDGMEVVERLEQIAVASIVKLREEGLKRPFTVFMGDRVGLDVFIGIRRDDFPFVQEWFTKFIAGSFISVAPEWRRFAAPKDGIATPRFRYTVNGIKDYRPDGVEQIGEKHNLYGVEMTYFETIDTGDEADSYND